MAHVFSITQLVDTILLRIDGHFVGAYDTMNQVNTVIDAYRGK